MPSYRDNDFQVQEKHGNISGFCSGGLMFNPMYRKRGSCLKARIAIFYIYVSGFLEISVALSE